MDEALARLMRNPETVQSLIRAESMINEAVVVHLDDDGNPI